MKSSTIWKVVLPPAIVLLVLVGIWDWAISYYEIKKFFLPTPAAVLLAFKSNAMSLLKATGVTAAAAACGFFASLVLGTLTAIVFAESRMIRTSCYPYAILLQTVPVVAIAPLIIVWFGNGFWSVVIISFIISLFPIITNGCTGLLDIDPNMLDLFRLHQASRWKTITKLRIPNSVPYLMTGVKISSGLAIIGAIVGDFLVGHGQDNPGLGYLILFAKSQLQTDKLFAAVICSTLLGVLIFAASSAFSRTVLKRWSRI